MASEFVVLTPLRFRFVQIMMSIQQICPIPSLSPIQRELMDTKSKAFFPDGHARHGSNVGCIYGIRSTTHQGIKALNDQTKCLINWPSSSGEEIQSKFLTHLWTERHVRTSIALPELCSRRANNELITCSKI